MFLVYNPINKFQNPLLTLKTEVENKPHLKVQLVASPSSEDDAT